MRVTQGTIEQLLSIADEKRETTELKLNGDNVRIFRSRLRDSIERFQSEQDDRFGPVVERKLEILNALYRALALHVVAHWNIDEMSEYLGFDGDPSSVDDVIAWLEADWGSIRDNSDYRHDWFEKSLIHAIDHAENECSGWLGLAEHAWDDHWSHYDASDFPEKSRSRQPGPIQRFMFDLCRLWQLYVDPDLQLPTRGEGKTNPLLRFIEFALGATLVDGHLEVKTIHTFVKDHAIKILLPTKSKKKAHLQVVSGSVEPFPIAKKRRST